VPEKTNYPIADSSMDERTIAVEKFGEQYGYTFEARLNDEYGELQQIPNGWAVNARYTEDDNALAQLASPTTGAPNPAFFNVGNANLGTGALTSENLMTAITAVSTKRDSQGRIRRPGPLQLVVGPALQMTAERILNVAEWRRTDADGTTFLEPNPVRGRLTLEVMENLPGAAWFV